MPCRFVLLTPGRTGSSYLTKSLNSHPNIIMLFEPWGSMFKTPKEKWTERARDQLKWLDNFFEKSYDAQISAIGFKTKLIDVLDPKMFMEMLREKDARIIYMVRKNIVKLAVSMVNARRIYAKTNTWNLKREKDRLPPFYLDPNEFVIELENAICLKNRLKAYIEELKLPTLKIYYKDLFLNESKTLRRINEFLGVPFVHTRSSLLKNTNDNLRKAVLNFDEIRSRYKDTVYEDMFDEISMSSENLFTRIKGYLSKKFIQ